AGVSAGATAGALLLLLLLPALDGCAGRPGTSPTPHTAAPDDAGVARSLDALFESRPYHRTTWGAQIVDVRSGRTLYERNAPRLMIPASNMKLLVTAAALDALGPHYRYRTSLYANGELRPDGTLSGNLILYGRGDPNISGRYVAGPTAIFSALADSLACRGVRRVEGGIVADQSWFDADPTRPDWEAYDLLWWYAAPVSALSFNDNSIDFTIRPGRPGEPALISAAPPSGFYSFRNLSRTVTRVDSGAVALDFKRDPGTNRITAYGDVAADAQTETESFAVVDPAAYAATVFRETLEAEGIAVARDPVTVVSDPRLSPVDSTSRLLAEHVSPPLEAVVNSINLRSQNLHAELLLKTLGKEKRGEGSWAAGIAAERDFLRRVGIADDGVSIRDGSGLSEGNLVTPGALVTLLRHMLRHPHGGIFFGSLPAAGGEGSLRSRFSNSPAADAIHAKTGTLEHVNSLSGYLVPVRGDTLAFSIIANNHGLESSQVVAALDSAVVTVVRGYRGS
ncbi:MAG: D-alanyl-D-alanine carboxypeptidase/D-alanyl-D-alanine-endopeptidase, partial [Gemmatimonadetes bacterium]|nr:D-alanyl-D-alanine carboxypeptidase/D-alanyl-D-alanine-endopeptidase [Gemmatimonadota bacterium]